MKLFIGLCFVAFFSLLSNVLGQDYCNIRGCGRRSHTLCMFRGSGRKCQPRYSGGVSGHDKRTILDVHNRLRARVALGRERRGSAGSQPPAANMLQLVWDNELANVAQRWADQCDFGHDRCRNVQRFQVGQNAAWAGRSSANDKIDWSSQINSWYNEVKDFDKRNVRRFGGVSSGSKQVGHYTQVVWAKTKYIGCGFTKYKSRSSGWNGANYLYICNYGPSGNFMGQPMYEIGKHCSRCPRGTRCGKGGFNGLCS